MTSQQTKYEIKDRTPTEVTLEITVDPAEVQAAIDEVYRRYSREVEIPGFRKGHVPRNLLEARLGKDVFQEEAQKDLAEKHIPQAISELGLHPVTPPKTEPVSFEDGGPYVFTASFSVLPEFELPEYKGIEITVPPLKPVTDADVEGALAEVQRRFGTLVPKEGEVVSDGDIVSVKEGDEEWDTRATADNPVTAKLIGRKVGETVDISLEVEDGKTVTTSLTILGLKKISLPEIDDDLAKDAGYDSLDALKADIRARLESARERERKHEIELKLLDKLIDQVEIPLPQALVEEIAEEELEDLKRDLDHPQSPLSFEEYLKEKEQTEDEVRADYRDRVASRIRRELMLRRIAEAEGIDIPDDELEEIARQEAEERHENPLRFIAKLKAEEKWDDYRTGKINARVFDLLYREAKIVEGDDAAEGEE